MPKQDIANADRELLRIVAKNIEIIARRPRTRDVMQAQLNLSSRIYEHLGRTEKRDD